MGLEGLERDDTGQGLGRMLQDSVREEGQWIDAARTIELEFALAAVMCAELSLEAAHASTSACPIECLQHIGRIGRWTLCAQIFDNAGVSCL